MTVNKSLLWDKLCKMGINGKIFKADKSLYTIVSSCVRIYGLKTDWFDVKTGLRQGSCIMLYADNIVILAETETD